MRTVTSCLLFATAIGSIGAAAPLAAQEATTATSSGGALEEIVVTAQRRQESVQDVPIAISAFTANELERRNINKALDLIQYVPNLMGSNNTGLGTANAYYLRGLGNTESIATFDPPVGTYIDDIYVSRQNGNNFSFFDVDRVEVLRGPQGTLFGRNTTGGAVGVYLKKPGEDFGGFGEALYGRYNRVGLRGSLDVPLSDGLRTKISGYFNDDDGYVKNITTGETLNDIHNYGMRAAVQADVTDKLAWDGSLMYTRDQSTNILNFDCNPANQSDCDGRFASTGLRKEFEDGKTQYVNASGASLGIAGEKAAYPLGNDVAATTLTSKFSWEVGDKGSVEVITGLIDMSQEFNLDFFDGRSAPSVGFVAGADGRPVATNIVANPAVRGYRTGGFAITNDGTHSQFTQELKLSNAVLDDRLTYVGGLFYINENNRTDFADIFTFGTGTGTSLLLADRIVRNRTKAWAGYFQADFNVSDMIKLTAGIRYTDEKKTVGVSDNRGSCNDGTVESSCLTTANIAANGVPTEQNAKLWTPRFAVNVKPSEDILLFASATKGFKSGGWNARSTAPNQFLNFDPEIVWSYEAGWKSQWLDDRVRFNFTGFYMNAKNYQVPSAFVNANGSLTFITRNFGGLRNDGAEIELQVLPVEGLTMFANIGVQNARYVDLDQPIVDQQASCRAALSNTADPRGDTRAAATRAGAYCGTGIVELDGDIAEPVRAPDVTFSIGANYEMPIPSMGVKFVPSVNVSYISNQEVGTSAISIYSSGGGLNTSGGDFVTGSYSKAVTRVNASLSLVTDDDSWSVTAECENCFGSIQNQSTLSNYSYLSPPSTWAVRLKRNF